MNISGQQVCPVPASTNATVWTYVVCMAPTDVAHTKDASHGLASSNSSSIQLPPVQQQQPVVLNTWLEQHVVGQSTLSTLAYVPDYLTADEQEQLLARVHSCKGAWTQLSGRRLQNHGGVVHAKGLLQAKLPPWLTSLSERLQRDTEVFGGHTPNHVLVNSYAPGEGIMPHQDGPAYWPGVCILSLGGPAIIRFWRKPGDGGAPSLDDPPAASLLLLPGSLLVFAGEAYTDCLHGIQQVTDEQLDPSVINLDCHSTYSPGDAVPRAHERISLTVRRVTKVVKNLIRLGAS